MSVAWGLPYIYFIYIYISQKQSHLSLLHYTSKLLASRMRPCRLHEAWDITSVPSEHLCLLLAEAAHPVVSMTPQIRRIPWGSCNFAFSYPHSLLHHSLPPEASSPLPTPTPCPSSSSSPRPLRDQPQPSQSTRPLEQ